MTKKPLSLPDNYDEFLQALKERIRTSQVRAALAVNKELIQLYWEVGKFIVQQQEEYSWGKGVIERLAKDLKKSFPGLKGFSARNLWRMRAFYLAYTVELPENLENSSELDGQNLPQAVAEIPWGHNIILLEKLKDPKIRLWYAKATIEYGWSRNILVLQLENQLYQRQGKATTNFQKTLPAPQSDLAQQSIKDPYIFDFLTLAEDAQEKVLEAGLIEHIKNFMLELGVGFAFVGNQYKLTVGEQDYYLDLLFYHLKLRCFVVIELKTKPFIPEYAGKMNFYLSAVDDLLKHSTDNPSIGMILCKSQDRINVEYALRGINKPIGVAQWQTELTKSLPEELQTDLPTIEEIEAELETVSEEV